MSKSWWSSKTLWVNAIAMLALAVQSFGTGFVIAPEQQAALLVVINLILRVLTKTELTG